MSAAQEIESICGAPIGDGEPPSWFKVGVAWKQYVGDEACEQGPLGTGASSVPVFKDHVVDWIVLREENRGDHGIGWYDVWAGDLRIASLNERNVAEIYWRLP